jgi:hypothetical protein
MTGDDILGVVNTDTWTGRMRGYNVAVFRRRGLWRWLARGTAYTQLGDCAGVDDGAAKAERWIKANPLPKK